ncbi:MAG: PEP-CTERM sorting domain-containing protein [Parvularculaceae bacterium]|nr:PEP-CTERM sorting domain-containing protein [Parvularculaceae bacterium]
MRVFLAAAMAAFVTATAPASAAITQFPTSVFQQAAGSGGNNLLGNTPATGLFNRGATPLGLGFASPIETSAILGERITLNITTVSASTTYVFVRLGRLTGGVFTSAAAAGPAFLPGFPTINLYAQVTGPGPLTLLLDPFAASCAGLGGCNALIIGNSGFSAAGSSFRASTLIGSTPEPAAWALMMLGFGAVAWRLKAERKVRPLAA